MRCLRYASNRWRSPHPPARAQCERTRGHTRHDLDAPAPPEGQAFVAISGDELIYMVDGSKDAAGRPLQRASGMADFVAYRVPLR
jgi:hypothetical protein